MVHNVVVTLKKSDEGVGLLGLLTLLFIGLKLTGFISWSWLWVFAPLWGPLAIVLAVLFFVGIGAAVFSVARARNEEKARKRRLAGCPY